MKLLLDQGAPRSAAALLRESGFDAVHTGEIGFADAKDHEIILYAKAEDRIAITLDADFHAILARQQLEKPSVIRIRIQGLKADDFRVLVLYVLEQCETELAAGAVVSVTETQVRVRRLPMG